MASDTDLKRTAGLRARRYAVVSDENRRARQAVATGDADALAESTTPLVLPEPTRERKSPMPPVPSGETAAGLLVKRMHRVVSNLNAPGTSNMLSLLATELCAQRPPAMVHSWIGRGLPDEVVAAVREGVRVGRLMQPEDQATLARLLVRRLPSYDADIAQLI